MDPRTMALGSDRWLTDSRVYNLVWLGRWIERAQTVARVLSWAARQESANGEGATIEEVLNMAASVRGVSISPGGLGIRRASDPRQRRVAERLPCCRQV